MKSKKPWFVAFFQPINEDYAEAIGQPKGSIWLTHVIADSPAAQAGLRSLDLAVEVNGQSVRKTTRNALTHFNRALDPEIGEKFSLKVIRDGKEITVKGKFIKRPEPKELKADDLGITVQDFSGLEYYAQNLFAKEGVLVKAVRRGSAAAVSSSFGQPLISRGNVIVEFDHQPIKSVKDFSAILEALRQRRAEVVLLKLYRGKTTVYAALNLKIGEENKGDKP